MSTSAAALAVPPPLRLAAAPGTGDHWLLPGAAEYSVCPVQPAAQLAPVPVHCAHTAKTRWPAVSSAVTRSPPVLICCQLCPPSWVAHSSGPNAHPSLVS